MSVMGYLVRGAREALACRSGYANRRRQDQAGGFGKAFSSMALWSLFRISEWTTAMGRRKTP
jgi:hypothetical protein